MNVKICICDDSSEERASINSLVREWSRQTEIRRMRVMGCPSGVAMLTMMQLGMANTSGASSP